MIIVNNKIETALSFWIILGFMGIFFSCKYKNFPSKIEIEKFFDEYKSERLQGKRAILLEKFLKRLSNPDNISDDTNIRYFIEQMIEIYLRTNDDAILIAVDNTPIQGGFANFICEFYNAIKFEKGFQNRYRSNAALREAIERCIGISFTREDIEGTSKSGY